MSKDGGPVYPLHNGDVWGGMTMRQYYKAAALTGILGNAEVDRLFQDLEAEGKFRLSRWSRAIVDIVGQIADDMIQEDEEHTNGDSRR